MGKDVAIVRAPASTANLGSGFDCIGMALNRYLTIEMAYSDYIRIRLSGEGQDFPRNRSNLIYQAAMEVFRKAGYPESELSIKVETQIPPERGLGSSAAAICGGMMAANRLLGDPFSKEELFPLAVKLEGHPDNVAASLFGGIVIAVPEGGKYRCLRIRPPKGMRIVAAIPDFSLSTRRAREALPDVYSKGDVIHSIGRSALLAGALATGDREALACAMDDRIHEPYRSNWIPGFRELKESCRAYGAAGVAISGAGPSVIALTWKDPAPLLAHMENVFRDHQVPVRLLELGIDLEGTAVLR